MIIIENKNIELEDIDKLLNELIYNSEVTDKGNYIPNSKGYF